MATRKKASARFERVVEEVQEAAGKASVKVEHAVDKLRDEASEAARDVREVGRRLDDRVRETAGAASEYVQDKTGVPAKKTRDPILVICWLILIGAVLLGIAKLLG